MTDKILAKIKYGCLLGLLIVSSLSAQSQPKLELKPIKGYRLVYLGQSMLGVSQEVVHWVKNTSSQNEDVATMMKNLQSGYENVGKILILGGTAKEIASIFLLDPEQEFKGKSDLRLAAARESKYSSIIAVLLQTYVDMKERELETSWMEALLNALFIDEKARDAYLRLRKQKPAATLAQEGAQALSYSSQLAASGTFEAFMKKGTDNIFLFALIKIFGGMRVYGVGVGVSGQLNIPIVSMMSKIALRRDITGQKFNGTAITTSGGALFVVKGVDGSRDPNASNFAATTYTSGGVKFSPPTFTNTGIKAVKAGVSASVILNLFTSSEELVDFQVMNLDDLACYKASLNSNVFASIDGAMKDVALKLSGDSSSLAFLQDNVRWGLGIVGVDRELVGKVPDRVYSFSTGEYAKNASNAVDSQLDVAWAPFQIEHSER